MSKTKKERAVRSAASILLEKNVLSQLYRMYAKYKTRAELAKAIGISAPSLTNALKGNPQLETIQKIADALGVSVASLFKEEKEKTVEGYVTINGTKKFVIDSVEELERAFTEAKEPSKR